MSALGALMFDLETLALTAEEREMLAHPAAGGVILFARNQADADQLTALIASIRAIRPGLLIAVDHEGGRVQRFREGFSRLPPMARYGEAYATAPARALRGAELAGWLAGAELRAFDIDLGFAPVLDVESGFSTVIGDRAFARDPETVTALARAYIRGVHRAGMAAVGKHYPGHGGVAADSHLELPCDHRPLTELEARDLIPFVRLGAEGLDGIMTAHVVYPQVDARPASFSPAWIRDMLRGRLGYDGAVFSDDLAMGGAAGFGDFPQRAAAALEAGCDMVLLCQRPEARGKLLEHLSVLPGPSQRRLAAMRGRPGPALRLLHASPAWREAAAETLMWCERR